MNDKLKYIGIYQQLLKKEKELVLIYVVKNGQIIKTHYKEYGKFVEINTKFSNINDAVCFYRRVELTEVKNLKETTVFLELL